MSLAYKVRFYLHLNAREAMHLLELRTTPQGHPAYRVVGQEMHRLIAEQAGHQAVAEAMRFVDHSPGAQPRAPGRRTTGGGPSADRARFVCGAPVTPCRRHATGRGCSALDAVISLRGVTKSFGTHTVLKDITFDIPRGKITAVMGPSGTGKSVLLKNIIGLLRPDAGEIWVEGEETVADGGAATSTGSAASSACCSRTAPSSAP